MSYYYLRPAPDSDSEPKEIRLRVGRKQIVGTVKVNRIQPELYMAECLNCGWCKQYHTASAHVVAWDIYCHNYVREHKHACPNNSATEEIVDVDHQLTG